jgi:hypothetical protein
VTNGRNTVVLDTNVLLLWLVGRTDPTLFRTFKRVSTFNTDDFVLLGRFLKGFEILITTPHVLAEVSNFVDQAPPYRRKELIASLQMFAQEYSEHYEPAKTLSQREEFAILALTDTGLAAMSLEAVVVTTDFHLWGRIQALGGKSVNFNHLRTSQFLSTSTKN